MNTWLARLSHTTLLRVFLDQEEQSLKESSGA